MYVPPLLLSTFSASSFFLLSWITVLFFQNRLHQNPWWHMTWIWVRFGVICIHTLKGRMCFITESPMALMPFTVSLLVVKLAKGKCGKWTWICMCNRFWYEIHTHVWFLKQTIPIGGRWNAPLVLGGLQAIRYHSLKLSDTRTGNAI